MSLNLNKYINARMRWIFVDSDILFFFSGTIIRNARWY